MGIGHKTGGVFVISDPRYCTLRTPVMGLGQHELCRSCSEGDGFALLSAHGQATAPLPKPWHCLTPCGGHRHSFTPSWHQGWSRLQKTGSLPGRQQQRTRLGSLPGDCGLGLVAVRRPRSPAGPGTSAPRCPLGVASPLPVLLIRFRSSYPGYLRAALLPGLQLGTLPSSAQINVSACK